MKFSEIKDYVLTPGAIIAEDMIKCGWNIDYVAEHSGIEKAVLLDFLRRWHIEGDKLAEEPFEIVAKLMYVNRSWNWGNLQIVLGDYLHKSCSKDCLVVTYDDVVDPHFDFSGFTALTEEMDQIIEDEVSAYCPLAVFENEVNVLGKILESFDFIDLAEERSRDEDILKRLSVYKANLKRVLNRSIGVREADKVADAVLGDVESRYISRPNAPIQIEGRIKRIQEELQSITQLLSDIVRFR